MDDYVAVCVQLKNGECRYFLTFGRLFDAVDGAELESIVLKHSSDFALGGTPVKTEVCYSLSDAAHSPYFHEAIITLLRNGPPHGMAKWKKWKAAMTKSVRAGEMLMFCGDPNQREQCRKDFWSMLPPSPRNR